MCQMTAGLTFSALLVALTCSSCGSLPRTNYYTLRIPPPPSQSADPKTTLTLGVERFGADEMLRDDRIVFYQSPTALNFYEYHRWSSDPATLMTELTARWLDQMGVYSRVLLLPTREAVDYTLHGYLLNFEEVDYEGADKGRVTLRLTLVRSRDRQVVWSAMRHTEHAAEGKGVDGVVSALDASSQELLRNVLPGLAAEIERESKEPQAR
jgi:ABC-type uncharacterized transport system auxiliary subunit